ncbi:hypothetical protein M5E89_13700 [Acidaminococcus intestini]|nr:hypothetical protein M5E89_13700 [Acidaminococcus intestini]
MLNVSGSMTNAIVVDKIMGTFDEEAFKKNKVGSKSLCRNGRGFLLDGCPRAGRMQAVVLGC